MGEKNFELQSDQKSDQRQKEKNPPSNSDEVLKILKNVEEYTQQLEDKKGSEQTGNDYIKGQLTTHEGLLRERRRNGIMLMTAQEKLKLLNEKEGLVINLGQEEIDRFENQQKRIEDLIECYQRDLKKVDDKIEEILKKPGIFQSLQNENEEFNNATKYLEQHKQLCDNVSTEFSKLREKTDKKIADFEQELQNIITEIDDFKKRKGQRETKVRKAEIKLNERVSSDLSLKARNIYHELIRFGNKNVSSQHHDGSLKNFKDKEKYPSLELFESWASQYNLDTFNSPALEGRYKERAESNKQLIDDIRKYEDQVNQWLEKINPKIDKITDSFLSLIHKK